MYNRLYPATKVPMITLAAKTHAPFSKHPEYRLDGLVVELPRTNQPITMDWLLKKLSGINVLLFHVLFFYHMFFNDSNTITIPGNEPSYRFYAQQSLKLRTLNLKLLNPQR